MFERFTQSARAVVVLAQEHARTLGATEIGSAHLLIGVCETRGSGRAAARRARDRRRRRPGRGPHGRRRVPAARRRGPRRPRHRPRRDPAPGRGDVRARGPGGHPRGRPSSEAGPSAVRPRGEDDACSSPCARPSGGATGTSGPSTCCSASSTRGAGPPGSSCGPAGSRSRPRGPSSTTRAAPLGLRLVRAFPCLDTRNARTKARRANYRDSTTSGMSIVSAWTRGAGHRQLRDLGAEARDLLGLARRAVVRDEDRDPGQRDRGHDDDRGGDAPPEAEGEDAGDDQARDTHRHDERVATLAGRELRRGRDRGSGDQDGGLLPTHVGLLSGRRCPVMVVRAEVVTARTSINTDSPVDHPAR